MEMRTSEILRLRRAAERQFESGDAAGARETLERTLQAWGEDAGLLSDLCVTEYAAGDLVGAAAHGRRAVELDPADSDARENLDVVEELLARAVPGAGQARRADPAVRASIVIPVFNKADMTARCLEAIAANTPEGLYEVVVVDNASSDSTPELLAAATGPITVVRNEINLGYTLACNVGATASSGEHLVFLNNDTEPQPGWLEALLGLVDSDPTVGAVGAKLVYPDGTLQEAGGLIFRDGSGWNFGRGGDPTAAPFSHRAEVDYSSGACLLVPTALFDEIGGFDARYAPAYYEDADLCFEVRGHGRRVVYEPGCVVIHHEGATAGTNLNVGFKRFQVRNQQRFVEKWAAELALQDVSPVASRVAPTTADRSRLRPPAPQPQPRPSAPPPASATTTGTGDGSPLRILVVDPLVPLHDRAAGSLRLFRLLGILRDAGHDVTFVAHNGLGGERYAAELEAMGIRVVLGDPNDRPSHQPSIDLEPLLADGRFDVAWLSFYEVAERYLAPIRRWSPGTTVAIDTVDVHWVRERRQAELADDAAGLTAALETRTREAAVYAAADLLVAVTDADAVELEALAPGVETVVVPLVQDPAPTGPSFKRRRGLLFVGNFAHTPNIDAAQWMAREVLPLVHRQMPGTRLTIVGTRPPAAIQSLQGRNVTVAGWVPKVAPYLDAARVSVAPLRFGAGMKGKVTEALAHGVPVVTTSIGAEGMDLCHGTDALIADDAAAFAEAVVRLYRDQGAWSAIADAGRDWVRRHTGTDVVAAMLADALRGTRQPIAAR